MMWILKWKIMIIVLWFNICALKLWWNVPHMWLTLNTKLSLCSWFTWISIPLLGIYCNSMVCDFFYFFLILSQVFLFFFLVFSHGILYFFLDIFPFFIFPSSFVSYMIIDLPNWIPCTWHLIFLHESWMNFL